MKRTLLVGLGLALAWACGGKTFVNDAGGSGSGGTAQSASGQTATGDVGVGTTASQASGTTATSTSATTTSTTATASSSSGGGCNPPCDLGMSCCAGKCVNENNDVLNCGGCGAKCAAFHPYCDNGKCGMPPCNGVPCAATLTCCGSTCCAVGELCCTVPGPGPSGGAKCYKAENGTCPPGCPGCKCAAPDTPIATPNGERAIASLRPGDLVYSIDGGQLRAVPIRAVKSLPVRNHHVMRVALESGRTLRISGDHPLADGRYLRDVRAGDVLFGQRVTAAGPVPYPFDRTYDILPDSDTGSYFAAGALIGSTLHGPTHVADASFALR